MIIANLLKVALASLLRAVDFLIRRIAEIAFSQAALLIGTVYVVVANLYKFRKALEVTAFENFMSVKVWSI